MVLSRQSGFALLENLIAIVLFTVGAMGIAASTATAIKVNADNQARAMALAVATKQLEPLYTKASGPGDAHTGFATSLRTYVATDAVAGVTAKGNVAAGASDDFFVSISQAVDADGKNVLTAAGPYVSPVTVAVLVTYEGNSGSKNATGTQELKDTKEFYASFTYVLGTP